MLVDVTSGDDRYTHIDKADMEKVVKACENKLNWLNDQVAKKNEMRKWETGGVTPEQIQTEQQVCF